MEISSISDIFLIIASVAVIFITILFGVLIFNIILFFRALRMMANKAGQAATLVSEDLRNFATQIKKEGFSLKLLLKFLFGFFSSKSSQKINKK